jgi:hypothetical protein
MILKYGLSHKKLGFLKLVTKMYYVDYGFLICIKYLKKIELSFFRLNF